MKPRFDKLVVLDLDETLVHAREEPLDRAADHVILGYSIYLRPGLAEFLAAVLDRFEVGVWTSSHSDYASAVISAILDPRRLRFVFARERCTRWTDLETRDQVWLKDIRKLRRFGFPPERILFVDDTPEKLRRSYGNLVRVAPFEGDVRDDELAFLSRYLEELGTVGDVRRVEKRGWRARMGS